MSRRTAWTIRVAALVASVPACYLLLVAVDSRSPWVVLAVVAVVGVGCGAIVYRLTAPRPPGGGRRRPRSRAR